MGYIKKNILKDGSITYTIQSKAKDPLTNKYQYKTLFSHFNSKL